MNRRQKIIVSITGIFIVLLALVGLTYAYFLTRITGNENDKSIEVTTANLSVTYNDDMDGDGEPDALMVFEKIQPSNTETYRKTFKVENTGNATATYSVILDNMVNDFDRNQDLQYTLTREGTTGNVAEGNLVVGTKQILIPKVEIENEGVHTYTLTIKYIETGTDQSIDMNKELSFRVNIDEATVTWDTAEEGTLLYALKTNAEEIFLDSIEDDYGTSYYYKGNVENNYVTYSNMCWRIVRIQGDGTIKLALADENSPCSGGTYSVDNNLSGFANNGANVAYNSNASTIQSKDNFIFENGDIPQFLTDWAAGKQLNVDSLVETDWCNDVAQVREIECTNHYKTYSLTLYSSTSRLIDSQDINKICENKEFSFNSVNSSLKCNTIGINDTKAIRYNNKIGILTADEAVLAGITSASTLVNTSSSYLIRNVNEGDANGQWTMSVGEYDPSWSYQSGIYNIFNSNTLATGSGKPLFAPISKVRPLIVLKSTVIASTSLDTTSYGQPGTHTNPYVIK